MLLTAADQPTEDWWRNNVRLVSVGICIWLCLTLLGAYFADEASIATWQFVLSAQLIPLGYLALVVGYGLIMNEREKNAQSQAHNAFEHEELRK